MRTRRRPVGHEQLQVEIRLPRPLHVEAVAAEHREAQVVADLRIDPPALPLHAQAFAASAVALVLAGKTEQVTLVVMGQLAVGRGPEQTVADPGGAVAILHAQLHAAGHRRPQRPRLGEHPGHRRPVHAFGLVDGVVGKAAGEGLRQDHQVGGPGQRRDQRGVMVAVAGRIVPAGIALHQGNTKIVHRRFSTGGGGGRWRRPGWRRSWRSTAEPGAGRPEGFHRTATAESRSRPFPRSASG